MKSIFIFYIVLSFISISYAQHFDWGNDGYQSFSGGGFFPNIDQSGIDLTLSGFSNDTTVNTYSELYTGINDMGRNGYIHNYQFGFSDSVYVSFYIEEINNGEFNYGGWIGGWNDKLKFSGNPVFTEVHEVDTSGNEITPKGYLYGFVKVTYPKTKGFVISHGLGNSGDYNPGYILISPLTIKKDSINLLTPRKVGDYIRCYPIPASSTVTIESTSIHDFRTLVFDAIGKLVLEFPLKSREIKEIDVSRFAAGMYQIQVWNESTFIETKKIMVIK